MKCYSPVPVLIAMTLLLSSCGSESADPAAQSINSGAVPPTSKAAIAGATATARPAITRPAITGLPLVGIDVFSGRPNPEWNLTAAEALEVAGLLNRIAPASKTERPTEGRLGFRSFYLRDVGHSLELPPSPHPIELQVTRDQVAAIVWVDGQQPRSVVFEDERSTVFPWILARLPKDIEPSVYELIVGSEPPR